MLDVRPAGAVGVDGGPVGEVGDQHLGEVVAVVRAFDHPVAGQGQHAGGAAAVPVVVPEPRPPPPRQAAVGDRVPAAVGQLSPPRRTGSVAQQAEHLRVTGRALAPAEVVALDQLRTVRRVGVRHQEPGRPATRRGPRRPRRRPRPGPPGPGGRSPAPRPSARATMPSVPCEMWCWRATRPVRVSHVHAVRRRLGGPQVRLHGEQRQLRVTDGESTQRDAGVAAEQLELRAPPGAVEPLPDRLERPVARRRRRQRRRAVPAPRAGRRPSRPARGTASCAPSRRRRRRPGCRAPRSARSPYRSSPKCALAPPAGSSTTPAVPL